MAERIWFIYKQLANTQLTDSLGRLYDALLIQIEKNRISIQPNEAFTFDFGAKELINMVGLPTNEGNAILRQLFDNKKVKLIDNKIHVTDIEEVEKQAKYYRKMEKIEKARKNSSLRV